IAVPGLINVDFADVKAIMTERGSALMGIGVASGENRAAEAAKKAICSPLLETSIDGARGVLMQVAGGTNLSLWEVNEAGDIVSAAADPDVNLIVGAVINPELQDEIVVTVIATGFDHQAQQSHAQQVQAAQQQVAATRASRPAYEEYTGPVSNSWDVPTVMRRRDGRFLRDR
ncbi:MAG: cell division protein FtsZ, partial [Alicyclobacillus sp.]|nr:cell division protein FtsZ [Alicyclobacillus sp.]